MLPTHGNPVGQVLVVQPSHTPPTYVGIDNSTAVVQPVNNTYTTNVAMKIYVDFVDIVKITSGSRYLAGNALDSFTVTNKAKALAGLTMAHSAESLMGTSKLPAGMELYSFMFVNSDPSVLAGHVEAGKLPAPATLLVGVGVGGVLTLVRVLLDFAVYKASGL